ncbi:Ldh family oxidoreductase [Amycolatopsis palatopharyngis]|uniref:Ldh family oxidoreductase n=1 Tax=Amycolatopsis palatopharyngis TaxID=187982 RepID=UPI0013BEA3B4|nr:Ldh family oxidoreductase [Amycolatopsis palatopharyngis]
MTTLVDPERLGNWVAAVLQRHGVQASHAQSTARVLVAADVQGIDSHGIARLPAYLGRLGSGATATEGQPCVVASSGATALVDGGNLMGHPVAEFAMAEAIARARSCGVGWVAVRNSNHFGIAGFYARLATDLGLIGLAGTNAGPRVAPAGANEPFLGTNPFAVAVPTSSPPAMVVDMATSAVATGKLELAARDGKPIPEGWGVDRDGHATTDAAALASGGWLLPLGSFRQLSSHKGFALGLLVEVFSGLLGGGPYGPGVQNLVFTAGDRPARVGHFLAAIDPARFGDAHSFTDAVSSLLADLHGLTPSDPETPVMTPGEPEWRCELERRRDGIPLGGEVLNSLTRIGEELALEFPSSAFG